MLKFYILVSRNLEKVLRHLKYLDKSEVVFVINTLDKEFEKECSQLLHLKRIAYHITESNGTPAKGKNSLLEIFQNSDNDYCVQIDGDDYLTPHGIDLYKRVAASKNAPDVICLRNQAAKVLDSEESFKQEKHITFIDMFFKRKNIDYDEMYNSLQEFSEHTAEEAKTIIEYHKIYYSQGYKYTDPEEAHCRVVFLSKKAAVFRFPEEFLIGEDTLHYYLLKNEHFCGRLKMVSNDERPTTYVYDQTDGNNIVFSEIYFNKNWQWMKDFNDKVAEYENHGILHAKELPKLKISYDSCELDDLGMLGLAEFDVSNGDVIKAPANADKKTLTSITQGYTTIACKNSS